MGTKFSVKVNVGYLYKMEGQAHRSKFKVTGAQNMLFLLERKFISLKVFGTKFGTEVDVGYLYV